MERVSGNLEENIAEMEARFANDSTFKKRNIKLKVSRGSPAVNCRVYFCDGMVNLMMLNESIVRPIVRFEPYGTVSDVLTLLECRVLEAGEVSKTQDFADIEHAVTYGDTVLFCDGVDTALLIGTKGFDRRGISEPLSETVLKGPREGFIEPLLMNISMVKRKVRSSNLKIEYFEVGEQSKTTACMMFIEGVADTKVLDELRRRLSEVKIDGVFNSNCLVEFTRDCWWSPFRLSGNTERPDTVAANLMEGRVALMVDGSPVAVTVPYLFIEQFQTSEDYAVTHQYASVARILRLIGFFISISIAPLYISLVTLHPELLPTTLLFSITAARQGVPMPTVLEATALLVAFNLLRESGARTPASIGQTFSIVGALILGQAAVEARFISAPMVIIIAFSGISGLMLPKLSNAVVLTRTVLMVLASCFGLYGYVGGMVWILLHLLSLRSFGIEYVQSSFLSAQGSHEDSILRTPFNHMRRKGRFISKGGAG